MLSALKLHKNKIAFGIGLIAVGILHQFIYPMGDDYYYGTFGSSLKHFIDMHIDHYVRVNGRAVIHVIVSLLLLANVYIWRILNPFVIMLTIWFIAKNAGYDGKNNSFIYSILIFLTFGVTIVAHGVYWLDGSVNYLYSSMMMLGAYYYYKKAKASEKRSHIGLCIMTFFAGATMEQTGLIICGLLVMDLFQDKVILKKNLHISSLISLICAVAGFLTVILAPGTLNRIGLQGAEAANMDSLVSYLLFLVFYDKSMVIVHIIIVIGSFLWLNEHKSIFNTIVKILSIIPLACFFYTFNLASVETDTLNVIMHKMGYISYSFILLYTAVRRWLTERDITELSFYIVAFGAQIMLLATTVFGGRTLLPSLLCLMVPAVTMLNRYKHKGILPISMVFILLTFERKLNYVLLGLIVLCGIFYLLKKVPYRAVTATGFVALAIFAGTQYQTLYTAYHANAYAHKLNLQSIEHVRNNPGEELVLQYMPYDQYGISFPYHSEYHYNWMLKFYKLPHDTKATYSYTATSDAYK